MTSHWDFTAVAGFFTNLADVQRETGAKVTTQPGLALLHRAYPTDDGHGDGKDWVRFANHVRALNRGAPLGVTYKVMYFTRHGFGYHNKKHAEVGTTDWDRYWSLLDRDEASTWFDAYLTDVGVGQAKDLCEFWMNAIDAEGVPLPQVIYTSPMARCLQTTQYAFSSVMESHGAPFSPIIKEGLRERDTLHTCDKRRTRSWIEENWPGYRIEEGLAEGDPFAGREVPESDEEHAARKQRTFEDIFNTDPSEFIELTVHSHAIWTILQVLKTEQFRVREGTSIALLVKGEKKAAQA